MNYQKDGFANNVLFTLACIAVIVADIALKVTGQIQLNIIVYVILCVVSFFVNAYTYLPLYTVAFILLKVTGRLFLGWQWIILSIVIDLMIEPSVEDMRKPKY